VTAVAFSPRVTVCDACLTASCWHGEHLCQKSRSAGLTKRTVAELDALGREHPDNYSEAKLRQVYGGRGAP
jgi:hypothetical protein